jgi:hypothetical protein
VSDHLASDLRHVMHEHDGAAPTATDLLHALRDAPTRERVPVWSRGRRRFVPLAAAAAVAVIIAGSVWAGANLTSAGSITSQRYHAVGSPLACPPRYAHAAPWVPAGPSRVPAARTRLVPQRLPRTAVICAYDGFNTGPSAGWKLAGRRLLSGDLARLAADLSWQPRKVPGQQNACTAVGGAQVNYLIGLTYPGRGRLWVAASRDPNDCVLTSNGTFTGYPGAGGDVARAFMSGRWPRSGPVSCRSTGPGLGRLGQDQAMVPPGAISMSICGGHGGPTLTSGFGGLVSALNALPSVTSTRECSMSPGHKGSFYSLRFGYPEGPGVQVIVSSGCVPAIDNGSLQSASARTIVPIIVRLQR